LKISKPVDRTWAEKKAHRPHWDENRSSADPWEEEMRKDCAEKIVLGGKRKKVRRNSPSYKKPMSITKTTTLWQLAQVVIARGGSQTVFELEINGRRFCITYRRETFIDPDGQWTPSIKKMTLADLVYAAIAKGAIT
jgi:hypothetical protein